MTDYWRESTAPLLEPLIAPNGAMTHGVWWQSTETHFVMKIPGLADCTASNGAVVNVARAPVADKIDLRLIVQGLPLAALCAQRKLLALHGAAVATPRGAIVVAGDSGAGKSTLAASLSRRGYPLLADAVTPLEVRDAPTVLVQPCMTDVALWRDAAAHLDFDTANLKAARPGLARFYVPDLPVSMQALPLHAVYLLATHNQESIRIEVVKGQRKLMAVLHFLFNRMFHQPSPVRQQTLADLGFALSHVRVCQLWRPDGVWMLDELAGRVEQDCLQ